MHSMEHCTLCPRKCGSDRLKSSGICGASNNIKAAKAGLHFWEEPCISGTNGSGTVFFSGCTLKCCYCQNYKISHQNFGAEISISRLADIFLELEELGACNINLVSPTQYIPMIINALDAVKHKLHIPIVYNTGGYENISTIKMLEGYVDIYLPDIKYMDSSISDRYSKASNYFEHASKAILEMHRQQPTLNWNGNLLKNGLLIRHLILPKCRHDSINILKWLNESIPTDSFLISLMSQYTPIFNSNLYPEINRRVSTFEYESVLNEALKLNIKGYMQDKISADSTYTPDFNLSGII